MLKSKAGIAVLLSVLLFICSVPTAVCGEQNAITASVNALTGQVNIDCSIPQGKPNQRINIQIINPGESISSPESLTDALQYTVQGRLSTDRRFSFSFTLSDDATTGDYAIYAKVYGITEPFSGSFYFADANTADSIIKGINDATTSDAVKTILEGKEDDIGLNQTYLKNEYRDTLYTQLAKRSGFHKDGAQAENRKTFLALCSDIIVSQAVSDGEDVSEVFESYQEYLGIPSMFGYYNDIENQSIINRYLSEKADNAGEKSIKEVMAQALLTQYDKSVSPMTWQMYETLLFDVTAEMGASNINKATYDGLADKKTVIESFVDLLGISSDGYSSLAEIVQEFNRIVNERAEQSQPPEIVTPPQIGGGGSFGGGGNLSISTQPSADTANPEEPKDMIFSDIADVTWAHEAIASLYEKNCISGVGDGKFSPNTYVKREEFLKMLLSAFELVKADAECSFSDVKTGAWYYSFVASAYDKSIVNGIGGNMFGIGSYITRQDAAVMICRAANYYLSEKNATFSDDKDISDYAKKAVYSLAKMKIINGVGDNKFLPLANTTRAEAAKMIYEALKYQQ